VSAVAAGRSWAVGAVRLRLGLVALLVGVAAAAWWWTAARMEGMDAGPWTSLGGAAWFVSLWVVMMAAMMFPSVAPTVALYAKMTTARSWLLPLAFAGGYLATWAAAGVGTYAVARVAGATAGDALDWDRA
jgi:predicted metal-binding membrane protein